MELGDLKNAGVEFVSMQFVDILGNIKSCETTLEHFEEVTGATAQPAPHDKAGYFDWSPLDEGSEVKRETMLTLQQMGVPMERLSHEVAHGQHEIGFKYDSALEMADRVLLIKNVVKIIAKKHGLYASFMPKTLFGKNGSGMHVH